MTVFAILAHNDPAMLARLSAALAPHRVYIHVDARRPIAPFAQALAGHTHAHFVRTERVTVNWGGWSQVEATLRLYHEILPRVRADEQVVLLSGHCYPLKRVNDIVRSLSDGTHPLYMNGVNYSEIQDRTRTRELHVYDRFPVRQSGIRRLLYAPPRKIVQQLAPKFPRTIAGEESLVLGSQWTVLTAEAIRSAVLPAYAALRPRLRSTFAPEEIFFTTAIYGSEFASQTQHGGPSDYVGEKMSQYANVHEMDVAMVKTYTADDWPVLRASEALFVRKVSSGESGTLLDIIDAERGVLPVHTGS